VEAKISMNYWLMMVNVNFVIETFVLLVGTFVMIHAIDMVNDLISNLVKIGLIVIWLG
jgi:hypothetical protein